MSEWLMHVNWNKYPKGDPKGRGGQFAPGDGDNDGKTEYQDSLRRTTDSKAARERLDAYYKAQGDKVDYKSSPRGPSGSNRSANPYVTKDGTLTKAGEERWAAEKLANKQKSKKNRVDDEKDLVDPKRWVKEDINALTEIAKASDQMTKATDKAVDMLFKTKPNERLDLSKMSDKEIRDILNRELLERQYNEVFNKPQENKGKEYIKKALEVNSILSSQLIAGLTIAGLIVTLTHVPPVAV